MKILLITFFNDESYGVRIINSILSQKHECYMLFVKQINIELIVKAIKNINPEVLGISLVSPNFKMYKKIYNDIRDAGNFKIILGGWHPTLNPEECYPYCDILCQGEGEEIIKDIMQDIENKKYKKHYFAHMVKKIDYPLPLFDNKFVYCIENNTIKHEEPYFNNTRYGTLIGRGCPHKCTYCSNSFMKNIYKEWGKIRYRDCKKVLEELKSVKKKLKKVERINFYDEVFSLQGEQLDWFLSEYKKDVCLPFYCMFYPGSCDDKKAYVLKNAGLAGVWVGVQSGSEQTRKKIFKRYYTNKTLFKQVEIFKKYDIEVRYDFIFDNLFETKEDFEKTLEVMSMLPEPCSFNMFQMKFFPNTEITKMALKLGLITKNNDEEENLGDIFNYTIEEKRQNEIKERIKKIKEKR